MRRRYVPTVLCLAICCVIGFTVGWNRASDVSFLVGIVLFIRGLWRYVTYVGVFNSTTYGFSQFKSTLENHVGENPQDKESFYAYQQRKRKGAKPYGGDLIQGGALIALSIICAML